MQSSAESMIVDVQIKGIFVSVNLYPQALPKKSDVSPGGKNFSKSVHI